MSNHMTQEEVEKMDYSQAIQILEPFQKMMLDQYGCPISEAYFALGKAIEALKAQLSEEGTTFGKWIPCSEMLPEEPSDGLHEFNDMTEHIVMISGASEPTVLSYMGDDVWMDMNYNFYKVVAWMPLPDPYVEQSK